MGKRKSVVLNLEETTVQPNGFHYQIFLFIVLPFVIFQDWVLLCGTTFFPITLIFLNFVLPLIETIELLQVCGVEMGFKWLWPSPHRKGDHLSGNSQQILASAWWPSASSPSPLTAWNKRQQTGWADVYVNIWMLGRWKMRGEIPSDGSTSAFPALWACVAKRLCFSSQGLQSF